MKERPILFSGPMVRAILDGSKTQTRRIIKPKQLAFIDEHQGFREPDNAEVCPHGKPGDRLWVRETFRTVDACECLETCHVRAHVWYEATASGYENASLNRLRPSIHMPRWASRIDLEITSIRVERLQDISEADALAEGILFQKLIAEPGDELGRRPPFRELWESINGCGSWATNPWVWVIDFKRLEQPS
jgi:hypothetical protein